MSGHIWEDPTIESMTDQKVRYWLSKQRNVKQEKSILKKKNKIENRIMKNLQQHQKKVSTQQ